MGYFWEELGKVKGANLGQFEQDQSSLNDAIKDLAQSRNYLQSLESAQLFGGQTDGAIAQAARGLGAHLQDLQDAAVEASKADAQAQAAIQAVQNHYDDLPDTEPNVFERFAALNPFVQVNSYIMTGQDFLSSVTAAREAERERLSKELLDHLDASFREHQSVLSGIIVKPIEFDFVDDDGAVAAPAPPRESAPVVPPGARPVPPGHGAPPDAPLPPGGMPPGGPVGSLPPGAVLPDADGDGVPDGVPVPDLAPGVPPVEEWPFRVYRPGDVSRDGPVDGGYSVPLNPRDGVLPRDPVWREMFEEHQRQAQARAGSGLGGLATAAGVAGLAGAAGMGRGLGAAGGLGRGGVTVPGAAGLSGAGGHSAGVGSAGGRGLGTGSGTGLPAGARGAGTGGVTPDGAGRGSGSGAAGAGGLRGAGGVGSGAAGAGSAAGAGRGMGGVPMGGMAGGSGSEEKDKGRRRRKYGKSGVEFFSMSDPVEPGAAAGEGGAADARLIDAPQRDEGDRW